MLQFCEGFRILLNVIRLDCGSTKGSGDLMLIALIVDGSVGLCGIE